MYFLFIYSIFHVQGFYVNIILGSCLLGYLYHRFTYSKLFKEKWDSNLVLPEAPSAQWSLLIESHNKLLEVSCHFAFCVQQFDKFQQTKRERERRGEKERGHVR
jgi:hypothetical protein